MKILWVLGILALAAQGWAATTRINGVETGGASGGVSDEAYNATTWNGVTTIAPSKNATRDKIESMGGGGTAWYAIVDATISGGAIAVTSAQRNIALIGEGGAVDVLTGISGAADGQMVTLWRKAGVGYTITLDTSGNFHLQDGQSFILNADHNNITLLHEGGNVWSEQGGRINAN